MLNILNHPKYYLNILPLGGLRPVEGYPDFKYILFLLEFSFLGIQIFFRAFLRKKGKNSAFENKYSTLYS